MHDSASSPDPQLSPDPTPGRAGDSTVGAEEAHEIIGTVVAWYSQLLAARPAGNQQRLEELMEQRQKCVDDQLQLRDVSPEEVARIAYTEQLRNRSS
ncbi:hypothetical protein AB0M32_09745 [Streptomyces sp. NPDC051985]|uniref:hypothetical protein n=1 Tax=Streptomyces sp. NPDC051985 TaxID=3155807 RepID=UPI003435AF77